MFSMTESIRTSDHRNNPADARPVRSRDRFSPAMRGFIPPMRGFTPAVRGFTLTEILIALALIVILLIGVSQVFTLTSSTISQGQAFSTALRTQRAVGQMLSNDILGFAEASGDRQDLGNDSLTPSGMRPLAPADPDERAPFLVISNFRVPAYLNQQAELSDPEQPAGLGFSVARSRSIRRDAATDPLVPIFITGDRNFRTDTISFFGRGNFTKQTGNINDRVSGTLQSTDAWIWFGHLRVFNGQSIADVNDFANAYGSPGQAVTEASPQRPNNNNRYAQQMILGRAQFLMFEPNTASGRFGTNELVYDENFVPQLFVYGAWTNSPQSTMAPFIKGSNIVRSYNTASTNVEYLNFRSTDPNEEELLSTRPRAITIQDGRVDVVGAGREEAMLQVASEANSPNPITSTWWNDLFTTSFLDRFGINPFPGRPFNSKKMGQRTQLLAEACTQFIVEFAGDFVTQSNTGGVTSLVPDDVIDFEIVGGQRRVRWFGLPRDVDGDGDIVGNQGDVVPLRDFRNGTAARFEKRVPPPATDYASVTEEYGASLDLSSYVCAWSPLNMDRDISNSEWQGVPSMLRIIVELRDPEGKLTQPVTQEYVFRVPQ